MTFHQGDWLRRAVANSGQSVAAFARRAGVSRDALNRWFRQPVLNMRVDLAVRVLRVLGYTPEKLIPGGAEEIRWAAEGDEPSASSLRVIGAAQTSKKLISAAMSPIQGGSQLGSSQAPRVAPPQELDQNVDPYSEQPWFEVPMFDLAVAAGRWVDVSEVAEVREGAQIDRGYFRIHIRGDSMQPAWPDGSIVEFSVLRNGRHAMEIGADYYVQRDGEATFKRLVKIGEDELVFAAVNKRKYPEPFVVARSAVVRMAKAEWMLNKPRKGRT